jgi:hypothetical protein
VQHQGRRLLKKWELLSVKIYADCCWRPKLIKRIYFLVRDMQEQNPLHHRHLVIKTLRPIRAACRYPMLCTSAFDAFVPVTPAIHWIVESGKHSENIVSVEATCHLCTIDELFKNRVGNCCTLGKLFCF